MASVLAITILGLTFSGRELAILAVAIVMVIGVIDVVGNSRLKK